MIRRALIIAAFAGFAHALAAAPAHAQGLVPRADALLRAGRVRSAEVLYFAATRRQPRDPEARFALGRYLASRGALRVGAVLIEEGRQFGGDSAQAAALLAPIYARLEDFRALTRLRHAALAPGELARARWLEANAPAVAGPDTVTLPLRPTEARGSLGMIPILIGRDTVLLAIDPSVAGIVMDSALARSPGVRVFDAAGAVERPAVVQRVALGRLQLRNVPVTLAPRRHAPARGAVGLDWLARWAPTFDPAGARTVTLRRAGELPPTFSRRGQYVPLMLGLPGAGGVAAAGAWIAVPGGLARLEGAEVARLRTSRVTLDPKRGELLIEP